MAIKSSFKKVMSGDHSSDYGVFVVSGVSVALALVMFLIANTVNEVKEYWFIGKTPAYTNSISVNGKGEIYAVSNIASFNFSIIEKGDTLPQAQESANSINNTIVTYLKENGIDAKDIKTTSYNAYPDYEYNPTTGSQTLKGHEVNINVSVKVRNADAAEGLLSAVGDMGVSNISGLTFTIDDDEALKREARDLAIEDAMTEATKLASKLGVKLGRVSGYYEMSNDPYYPTYDGYYGGDMKSESMSIDLERGEQKITSQVSVTFEIEE